MRDVTRRKVWAIGIAILGAATLAWGAQELVISAKLDKTAITLGETAQLTITLSGDLAEAQLAPPQWPSGVAVAGSSQSTNFSIHDGTVDRSTTLLFVLVPRQAGTFQIGPFTVMQRRQVFKTPPLELLVKKSALPPRLAPSADRFTL